MSWFKEALDNFYKQIPKEEDRWASHWNHIFKLTLKGQSRRNYEAGYENTNWN